MLSPVKPLSGAKQLQVAVASVPASTAAYYAASRWLDGFAYRADLGAGPFLLGSLATVSEQVLRALGGIPCKR